MGERRSRRRHRRELERLMAELDAADARYGLGAYPTAHPAAGARRRRTARRVPGLVGALSAFVLAGVVLAYVPGQAGDSFRWFLHLPSRLSTAPASANAVGPHAFLLKQAGLATPVSYDPCQKIHYVINPDHGPAGYERLIRSAVAEASKASGFLFAYDGTTDARDFQRSSGPVLIGFATDAELDALSQHHSDAVGVGGSVPGPPLGAGYRYYRTGLIALKGSWFRRTDVAGDQLLERAVVMHELGHVLGLDHVDDPSELMYPSTSDQRTYGPGDLQGLGQLSGLPCV